ncbi:GNAT family N-acetyltransferase [Bacillus sp. JJ1764]|uniref:GNAT family N-acetyltransferase n=1 Tax=Bacillus sp. JJ1764 TaxID=3122964 RepID=UPI00300021E9
MEIYLDKLKEADKEELFQFECENRAFFEKMVPSRGNQYYQFENFTESISELLKEQREGISYFHLIKHSGTIIGRMNLVDIVAGRGDLGYRMGEKYAGKGFASKALHMLLQKVREYNLEEIHAKTTNLNIQSQKVLEKNHFKRISVDYEEPDFNGQKIKFYHYIWKN